MISPLVGLKFLSGFYFIQGESKIIEEEVFIGQSSRVPGFRLKSYQFQKSHPESTIILLHGMNSLGIDDPRIFKLAKIITYMGYRVLVPEVQDIKNLIIREQSITSLESVLRTLIESYRLEEKHLGLFGVSFSGGMGLLSLCQSGLDSSFQSILALGSYSNFETTIPYVVENFDSDNYGTFILFYNFIENIVKNSDFLKSIFYEAALDNALYRKGENAIAPKIFEKLNERDRDIYNKVLYQKDFRFFLQNEISVKSRSLIRNLSPINKIDSLKVPLFLVHGKSDKVISETESINLALKLEKLNKEVKLEITELLSHGDTRTAWMGLKDVPGLSNIFGSFFNKI